MKGSITMEGLREEIRAIRKTLDEQPHMFVAVHNSEAAEVVRRLARAMHIRDENLDIYVQPTLLGPGEAVVGKVPPLMVSLLETDHPLPLQPSP